MNPRDQTNRVLPVPGRAAVTVTSLTRTGCPVRTRPLSQASPATAAPPARARAVTSSSSSSSSSSPFYRGWDVHAYTRALREQLDAYPVPCVYTPSVFADAVAQVRTRYACSPAALVGVANIVRRHDVRAGGFFDPDLRNMNGANLFIALWHEVQAVGLYDAFAECLADVASTCMQGVTHRMFSYWIVLQQDRHNSVVAAAAAATTTTTLATHERERCT